MSFFQGFKHFCCGLIQLTEEGQMAVFSFVTALRRHKKAVTRHRTNKALDKSVKFQGVVFRGIETWKREMSGENVFNM